MSTYLYLECLDHDPALRSDGESGQHLTDLPEIRRDIANRKAIDSAAAVWDLGSRTRNNTARFLSEHPMCRIGIRDEYGHEHSTKGDE